MNAYTCMLTRITTRAMHGRKWVLLWYPNVDS